MAEHGRRNTPPGGGGRWNGRTRVERTALVRRRLRERRQPWRVWLGRTLADLWLLVVYALLVLGMGVLGASMVPLRLDAARDGAPTVITGADGRPLARLYEHYRVPVAIDDVPAHTIHAVLAAEDTRFFTHHGLDGRGIARALWFNLRAGRVVQGGSTITQQLVRLELLDDERTLPRKLREVVLALRVERGMTKREILERYLNAVYFGGGAYGIGAAAQSYFRKPVHALTPAESALLAGLIRAPGAGDPRHNRALAIRRQQDTLRAMHRYGWLTDEQLANALHARLVIRTRPGRQAWLAPYVVEAVRRELETRYGRDLVYHGGLTVTTTIDPRLQWAAEQALRGAVRDGRGRGVGNGALVAIDPSTGEIRALVGGTSFRTSQFNRVTQAHRQPGSSFKAFVYLAALEHGMVLSDTEEDGPIAVGGWRPGNAGGQYYGRVTLAAALAHSLNSVAVRLTMRLSPLAVADAARRAGITSPLEPQLTLALGASEVTPLEMAGAFATFANDGKRIEPGLIREIRQGDTVIVRRRAIAQQTLPATAVYQLSQGLSGVISGGTGRGANIGRPAAGKTGTSNDCRDAWFVGYTPDLAAAVWLGNDAHRPMAGVYGGSLPARAWAAFMRTALRDVPPHDFAIPQGLMPVTICVETGLQATPYCPVTTTRYLPPGRIPPLCSRHTAPPLPDPAPPAYEVTPQDELPPPVTEPGLTPADPAPEDAPPVAEPAPVLSERTPPVAVPVPERVRPEPIRPERERPARPAPRPSPEVEEPAAEPGPDELLPAPEPPVPSEPPGKVEKVLPPRPLPDPPPGPDDGLSPGAVFWRWLRSLLS